MHTLKQQAAIQAATYVKDDMIVGLGTGSTSYYLVEEIGRRVRDEGLHITGVTTSNKTAQQAEALHIPLRSINDVPYVDITIDGADEVDPQFNGIKGGGGALLYEKTVATYSKDYIWIVDQSKMVQQLGAFPLPIEVVPYGAEKLFQLFETYHMHPTWRMQQTERFVTDSGHYIIDCHLDRIQHAPALAQWLDHLTGVVEHGLFIDMARTVIIGTTDGPITKRRFS